MNVRIQKAENGYIISIGMGMNGCGRFDNTKFVYNDKKSALDKVSELVDKKEEGPIDLAGHLINGYDTNPA